MARKYIDKGIRNGCVKLAENKCKAPKQTNEIYAVYRNGKLDSVERFRKAAIRYCTEHDEPNATFHIRFYNKLVYFHEHGREPMFFNGFHIAKWRNKPFEKALIDYEGHTPKDVTEQYDLIAHALEQSAQDK